MGDGKKKKKRKRKKEGKKNQMITSLQNRRDVK
jgi:hypothetical protein